MIPIPPGPGGVAIAAMVSPLLRAGRVFSEGINESIFLVISYFCCPSFFWQGLFCFYFQGDRSILS
jgi:hypothetical protein